MDERTIGFVGLGRLGYPIASLLVGAGHPVVCCRRGRSKALVARGASIAGDGSPRAVAEAADVLFTCLPGDEMVEAFAGTDGILTARAPLPLVVELSTAPLADKRSLRGQVAELGGDLLDCPVSGTPQMALDRAAVIYASGEQATYDAVAGLLSDISPAQTYVGNLGLGTKLKYVANLLVSAHLIAAAEAMAFAKMLGLDLRLVADLLSRTPAATSGQFQVRAPMIAAGDFEGRLVTLKDLREVLGQISETAAEAGANVPLTAAVIQVVDKLAPGDWQSDPGKLAALLNGNRDPKPPKADATPLPASYYDQPDLAQTISGREAQMLKRTFYVALSKVQDRGWPPPLSVLNDHLDWVQELERRGVLFGAGPLVREDGGLLGDGLFIVRADNAADAERFLADDPMHTGGFRAFTLQRWTMHEGTVNISATFSDSTYTIT